MYICLCNAITESDLEKDPFLINVIGNQCGTCIRSPIEVKDATYIVRFEDKFDRGYPQGYRNQITRQDSS